MFSKGKVREDKAVEKEITISYEQNVLKLTYPGHDTRTMLAAMALPTNCTINMNINNTNDDGSVRPNAIEITAIKLGQQKYQVSPEHAATIIDALVAKKMLNANEAKQGKAAIDAARNGLTK